MKIYVAPAVEEAALSSGKKRKDRMKLSLSHKNKNWWKNWFEESPVTYFRFVKFSFPVTHFRFCKIFIPSYAFSFCKIFIPSYVFSFCKIFIPSYAFSFCKIFIPSYVFDALIYYLETGHSCPLN